MVLVPGSGPFTACTSAQSSPLSSRTTTSSETSREGFAAWTPLAMRIHARRGQGTTRGGLPCMRSRSSSLPRARGRQGHRRRYRLGSRHPSAQPADGSCKYLPQSRKGDYGNVIVTEHMLNGLRVWALYGHLSAKSTKASATAATAGEVLAGWATARERRLAVARTSKSWSSCPRMTCRRGRGGQPRRAAPATIPTERRSPALARATGCLSPEADASPRVAPEPDAGNQLIMLMMSMMVFDHAVRDPATRFCLRQRIRKASLVGSRPRTQRDDGPAVNMAMSTFTPMMNSTTPAAEAALSDVNPNSGRHDTRQVKTASRQLLSHADAAHTEELRWASVSASRRNWRVRLSLRRSRHTKSRSHRQAGRRADDHRRDEVTSPLNDVEVQEAAVDATRIADNDDDMPQWLRSAESIPQGTRRDPVARHQPGNAARGPPGSALAPAGPRVPLIGCRGTLHRTAATRPSRSSAHREGGAAGSAGAPGGQGRGYASSARRRAESRLRGGGGGRAGGVCGARGGERGAHVEAARGAERSDA